MALCDPCYDLFRIPEDQRREEETVNEVWKDEDDDSPSATEFHGCLSFSMTLSQPPGLIHSSWQSFCESLDSFCPVCWIVWRHIRESPMASYHDQVRQEFYLCPTGGHDLTNVSGTLELQCSHDTKTWDAIVLWFKRTTKQRFEEVVDETPLEDHMGSGTTMKTVKNWLSKCNEGHSHGGDGCVTKRRAVNKPTIPTRLIDVHNSDSQTWSLVETRNHHDFSQYVALSHQWTTNTPRLLRSNYLTFQTNQSDMILPRSYQDVFVLCRNLGIQYVWIDSLCIFQDSADDFLHEAATMTEVYANAFCTFSICWESLCGFLRPRDTRVLARWDGGDPESSALSDRYVFVQDQRELRTAIDQTPVNRRGWVLQEQLLSARVLYLGDDQFYWQCDEATASETAPIKTYTGAGDYERRNLLAHENRNHSAWKNLVVQFMELDLTFERDRLLAISGIARFLLRPLETTLPIDSNPELHEKKTKKPDQAVGYVAGLNSAYWVEDLLWYPVTTTQTPLLGSGPFDRRPGNIVPSWSWAACPGPIRWSLEHFNPRAARRTKRIPGTEGGSLAYLRSINFEPLGSDVYGLPKSASLEISCLLVQARYTNIGEPSNYHRVVSSTDQTENVNYYATTDGFLLPLPYPRAHSDEASTLDVILEPCVNIVPTCFIVPLVYTRTWKMPRIMGLVVQERPQNDGSVKMREFVRIGSFTKHYGLGPDEVIHALVKNLPVGGDEFEQRLRDSARAWKGAENEDGDTKEKGTAKAEWMTIRLV